MSWEPVVTDITRMLMETVKVHQPLPDFTSNNRILCLERKFLHVKVSSCLEYLSFCYDIYCLKFSLINSK